MASFKNVISEQCENYAKDERVRFIGYNTVYGSRMYGTLSNIPVASCIEAPVAENLMMGLAMGMALEGFKPVVCFERHDFMLLALDAIVNQMDKMPWISNNQFKFPILIRAITGAKKPLNAGPMHTQNYRSALTQMLRYTPVYQPIKESEFKIAWEDVGKSESGAIIIVEHRDWYEQECPAE